MMYLMQMVLQVLHYSEEKIGLSQQIYDYVDQKIRRLDKDLKNFEGDIIRERSKLGLAVSRLLSPALSKAAMLPKSECSSLLPSHADFY